MMGLSHARDIRSTVTVEWEGSSMSDCPDQNQPVEDHVAIHLTKYCWTANLPNVLLSSPAMVSYTLGTATVRLELRPSVTDKTCSTDGARSVTAVWSLTQPAAAPPPDQQEHLDVVLHTVTLMGSYCGRPEVTEPRLVNEAELVAAGVPVHSATDLAASVMIRPQPLALEPGFLMHAIPMVAGPAQGQQAGQQPKPSWNDLNIALRWLCRGDHPGPAVDRFLMVWIAFNALYEGAAASHGSTPLGAKGKEAHRDRPDIVAFLEQCDASAAFLEVSTTREFPTYRESLARWEEDLIQTSGTSDTASSSHAEDSSQFVFDINKRIRTLRDSQGVVNSRLLSEAICLAMYDYRCSLFHGDMTPDQSERLAQTCLGILQPLVRGYLRRRLGAEH